MEKEKGIRLPLSTLGLQGLLHRITSINRMKADTRGDILAVFSLLRNVPRTVKTAFY